MELRDLQMPFPAEDIEWRVQSAGYATNGPWARVLAYVTNRAIQARLDDVCGPLGWQNEYSVGPGGGVICGISVWDAQHKQWVTKWDGSDNTQIEAVKGGLSGSMKRAGSQWGIGRYLYNLDSGFAMCQENKPPRDQSNLWSQHYDKEKKTKFYWAAPELPAWALPTGKVDPVSKLITHSSKLIEHMNSLNVVRNGIASGDISGAAEAWEEIPRDDQKILWLAMTKGGFLTPQEKEVIQSTEFRTVNQ